MFRSFGKTDTGAKRKNNQDCFCILERSDFLLAVVCDGMGGAQGGKVASNTAMHAFCDVIKNAFALPPAFGMQEQDVESLLRQAVSDANSEVFRKAADNSDLEGMGTTLVAVFLCKNGGYAINVGDSRLYLQTEDGFAPFTHDHSFIQYLLDRNLITREEAKTHPNRNIILRALGIHEEIEADFYHLPDFQRLLLCSDGLYNMLTADQMQEIADGTYAMKKRPPGYRARVNELVRAANRAGGTDNITAVLIGKDERT